MTKSKYNEGDRAIKITADGDSQVYEIDLRNGSKATLIVPKILNLNAGMLLKNYISSIIEDLTDEDVNDHLKYNDYLESIELEAEQNVLDEWLDDD